MYGKLTPRETDVLQLIGRGMSNKEIARTLSLSDHSIKEYVSVILGKLGFRNRTEAAVKYRLALGVLDHKNEAGGGDL